MLWFRFIQPVYLLMISIHLRATAFAPLLRPSNHHARLMMARRKHSSSLHAKQEATFGMGCFWAPSERLLQTDGVIDTVVGYTGNPAGAQDENKKKAPPPPTYDSVCFSRDWVEGVRVTYDDTQLDYEQLLEAFFEAQEPRLGSRQYASIIFPHSDEQERVARDWLLQHETRVRSDGVSTAMTSIEPLSDFYQAEGYHQRYWQKMRPRLAAAVALIAIATGILDALVPTNYQSSVHTAANAAVLLGCLYTLLERKLDARVVKLQ